MKTKDVIKGLQILMPYYNEQDSYNNGAEHDQLYAYPTDIALSDADIDKMIKLNWFQDYAGSGFSRDNYNQEESWSCYL